MEILDQGASKYGRVVFFQVVDFLLYPYHKDTMGERGEKTLQDLFHEGTNPIFF